MGIMVVVLNSRASNIFTDMLVKRGSSRNGDVVGTLVILGSVLLFGSVLVVFRGWFFFLLGALFCVFRAVCCCFWVGIGRPVLGVCCGLLIVPGPCGFFFLAFALFLLLFVVCLGGVSAWALLQLWCSASCLL
ncbi:hypothetical protein Ddye_005355 [Dipteronia dyeriana]|uniref:Transmembrane protein n=1 Tax=Dipteronia dyeriana TaxID=168575 RepID=A0AAD9XGC1_9ROSI|nr:hypothetical protein Ddye_005355 [Dipteronia dyeriana]